MSDKRKAKEILKKISKQKKRVAKNFGSKMEKKSHLFSILIPIFAGILFVIFSILNLKASVSFDESYSAYLTRGDYGQIFSLSGSYVNPPLYYFTLKAWSSVFGSSDIAMRFMSVFFGLIAIVFIFHLLKKLFKIKAAAIGTLFAAISPMFIRYSQEIGMYTMVIALVMAASFFLSFALEKFNKKGGRKYLVIYAILAVMAVWTHYLAWLAIIAHFVFVIQHFGGFKKVYNSKKIFKPLLFTYVPVVLLFVPLIPSFFNQIKIVQTGNLVSPVSFESTAEFMSLAIFSNSANDVRDWGFVFGVALIMTFVVAFTKTYKEQNAKNKSKFRFLAILGGLPIILMIILSLPPFKSIFTSKYVLYSIVTIWILFGVTVILIKETWIKNLLAALVVVVSIFGIVFVTNRTTEGHISEILAETFIAADESEPIIVNNARNYYDGVFYSNDKHKIYLFEEDIEYGDGALEPIRNYRVNLIENKEEFLKDKKKIWYIMDTPENGDDIEIPEWAKDMRIASEISFDYHTAIRFAKD